MDGASDSRLERLARQFAIAGEPVDWSPLGSGHINDTFLATYACDGGSMKFVHQRINTDVFRDPEAVMENISRVLDHLGAKCRAGDSIAAGMSALELVPAIDGRNFVVLGGDEYWRTYLYVDGAETIDTAATPSQVKNAAAAYGRFQRLLADLPGPRLHDTIPGFHDTDSRYGDLRAAVEDDDAGRAAACGVEIGFAESESRLATAIHLSALPERITHNDTKLNNVMLDVATGEAVCVIDLDTVMPGTVLYDFGDMVRSATITTAEDEPDADAVRIDLNVFEALATGYLGATADWLTAEETAGLGLSCEVITYEIGIRFLSDFLRGDRYFKTAYTEHNLVRARAQFALLEDMQRNRDRMSAILERKLGEALSPGRQRQVR